MILSIREADKSDIEQMSEVVNSAWKEAYKSLITPLDMDRFTDKKHRSESFSQMLKHRDFVYVLLCDGIVSAVCSAAEYTDRDLFDACIINQLYVSPMQQRKGFGRKLLFYVLRSMRGKGFKQAALYVMQRNDSAIAFYEKFGFSADGKYEKCKAFTNENLLIRYVIEL